MRSLVGLTCAVLLFGCSDDGKVKHLPDAPPLPADASVDAATEGPVSLSIFEGSMPRVGIRVLFQNADSSVVSDTTTGSDGKASAVMKVGGFVTAFDPFPFQQPTGIASRPDLRTFAGVKPGDQLRLVEQGIVEVGITVTFILPIDAAASEYHVWTNCMFNQTITAPGSGAQPMGTFSMSGCGPTANVLVEVIDANFAPIRQIFKPSVTLTDNGTVDLMADTYTAIPDTTYAYMNMPAAFSNVNVYGVRATTLGMIRDFSNGVQLAAGAGMFTERVPAITGATAATMSTFFGSSSFTQHVVAEWGAPGDYTLDGTSLFLGDFDGAATLDVPGHAITWAVTGGSVQPDLVHVRTFLNRDGATPLSWSWEIAAPGGTKAVFPVLPDSSQFNFQAGDAGFFDVRVAKVPGGYDAVRAKILALSGLQDIAVGASGKAVFAFLVEPGARKQPVVPTVVRGRTQTRW